jgi:hypothetical protein
LYGPQRVQADIIEDRGPLGVKGRRLYGVRLEFGEPSEFEMPEDELDPSAVPDKEAMLRYLKAGGLRAFGKNEIVGTAAALRFHVVGVDRRHPWSACHENFSQ